MNKTFEYFNPNPLAETFKSGKPKQWYRNDSSIRAICKVLNKEWIDVFDELHNIARNAYSMIDCKDVVNTMLESYGLTYITYGKPKEGEKRLTVKDFVQKYDKGTYILYLRNYYVAIIDGVVYNTENVDNASIYSCWKL